MFYKLMKKDFTASKNAILLNLIILLVFGGVMLKITQLDFFLFILIIYIVVFALTPIIVEDKLKTGGFILSLPLKRSKIVFGRYITALVIMEALILVVIPYSLLLERVMATNYIDFLGSMSFSLVFSVIFFAVIAISFFIPFVYRFGQMGIMIAMTASMLVTTLLFVITSLGFKGNFLRNTLGAFFERLENGAITNFFSGFSGSMGIPLAAAAMFSVMAVVLFISIKLSQFVYSRKEF